MKAYYALIPEKEKLVFKEENLDPTTIGSNQILIEAETSVISAGTELAAFTALSKGVYKKGSRNAYPWRPGYGLIGRVLEKGNHITRVANGDHIFCFGTHASHQFYEMDESGQKPFQSAFKIDEDIPAEVAVIARMGLIAITASQISNLLLNSTVAVFGLGTVGNLAAQIFQLHGCCVIGLDPNNNRCAIAKSTGINQVSDTSPESQILKVMEFTDGKGADICVDAVGDSCVIKNCLRSATRYGQVILLGSPRADYKANLTEEFNLIHMHSLTLRGALEWHLPAYNADGIKHSVSSNLDILLNLIRTDQLKVRQLISHIIRPDELLSAYQGLLTRKDKYLSVVIDWSK
ncbi:MAG TPA: hypothetical protein DCK95_04450 [Anaerolineaceae bacterium]|nr:hypothetical protein [Anaerolineaceae bacterium]